MSLGPNGRYCTCICIRGGDSLVRRGIWQDSKRGDSDRVREHYDHFDCRDVDNNLRLVTMHALLRNVMKAWGLNGGAMLLNDLPVLRV